MGRRPCCAKVGLNRGAWTAREDRILTSYIKTHGEGKWRDLPQRAGLKRCGKSCRLRWLNYLRPDIRRGNISVEEEELIIRLHNLLGNRWSLIAGRLPGRTDNEIKNYWNTNLCKKIRGRDQDGQNCTKQLIQQLKEKESMVMNPHTVIRTKAIRITNVIIPQKQQQEEEEDSTINNQIIMVNKDLENDNKFSSSSPPLKDDHDQYTTSNFLMDFDLSDIFLSDVLNSEFYDQESKEISKSNENDDHTMVMNIDNGDYYGGGMNMNMNMCLDSEIGTIPEFEALFNNSANDDDDDQELLQNWRPCDDHQLNEA